MRLMLVKGGEFLRSRAGRLSLRYVLLCAVVAASLGVGFHHLNIRLFERNKAEEKLTVLELVDAFVGRYSAIPSPDLGSAAPVPATFRAESIEMFNARRAGPCRGGITIHLSD